MATDRPGGTRATEQARLALTQLPPSATLHTAFSLACESAADALKVERVGVWLFVDNRSALRCACLFERSRRKFSSGSILRVADFPTYFGAIVLDRSVPAEMASSDPRTAELAAAYLTPLGITSMLDAGIFVNGELVGIFCHEHVGDPIDWTTEARDFAGSMADLLALRVQSAEVAELKTAFRTHESRLAALQKVQAIEQVTAGVAHDFTNLLAIISGKAQLLERDESLSEEGRRQAADIVQAAERGNSLMNELREFARPAPRTPTVIDLAATTTEFLPLLRSTFGRKHDAVYEQPMELGRVLLDKTQYLRVLLNLALNARDASPRGGTIRIRLASVRLTIGDEAAGHFVLLEVGDNGSGMDEATRCRALEPFFTTKAEGTGLGLAVVHRIVDEVGGLIRIESEPGLGTIVRVFFPRVGASSNGSIEFALPPEIRTRCGG